MKILFLILPLLILAGCANRSVKVLDSRWVSMKHSSPPLKGTPLKAVGGVDETFCMSSWSGAFGLMDEVVKKAEQKYDIDYIRDASFTKAVGRECVSVVGQGYRVVR